MPRGFIRLLLCARPASTLMHALPIAVVLAAFSVPVTLTPSKPEPGCRLIVQRADGETVGPCDDRKLAGSRGRAWLESSTQISSRSVDLTTEVEDPRVVLPWSFAGTATAASVQSDREEQIEWFAAAGAFRRYSRAGENVRLPEGPAIAITRQRGQILAMSRPLNIARRGRQEAKWNLATGDMSQMVALLRWPAKERGGAEQRASLTLVSGAMRQAPDVLFFTEELLLGIWYQINSGAQTLEVQSSVVHLPDNALQLKGGRLNALEGELRPLPSLVLSAGDEAGDEWPKLVAAIRDAATGAALREASLRLGEQVVVEHLPPRQVLVILTVGDAWRFTRSADLSLAEPTAVDFGLSPFHVAGELRERDRPVAGTVRFRSDEQWFSVDADERGRFELDVWSAGRYIYEARAAGHDARVPAYANNVMLSPSTPEITIRLPSELLRVRVTDADTGAPLKDAAVTLQNTWIDPTEGRRRFASRFAVDSDGEVTLPPIHAGDVELLVHAPGYVSDEQKLTIPSGTDRLLRIALRHEETSALRIMLASGVPAIGAEAVAFTHGVIAAWRDATDEKGILRVPNRLRGAFLVIRHREAGSSVVLFDDVVLARGSVRLPMPATEIAIRVEGQGPENPAVVIWLDGIRLDARATAFAVWSPLPFVDQTGVWRARNLPASDLRLLATSMRNLERVRTGALDAVFSTIRFPWSGVVSVRITE